MKKNQRNGPIKASKMKKQRRKFAVRLCVKLLVTTQLATLVQLNNEKFTPPRQRPTICAFKIASLRDFLRFYKDTVLIVYDVF